MAYYCLHKFHWPPSLFLEMTAREKAFVIAAIRKKAAADKKEADRLRSKKR
ncbi:hypothetical protein [Anaerotruncus colihominis]|uniref:hypothetical protein n=1 Tax=Anaerotruncus colihominis TaxID=169435 RepID=UPI0024322BE6|nr:hypothetical protein [Anaerotruncus colihominis]